MAQIFLMNLTSGVAITKITTVRIEKERYIPINIIFVAIKRNNLVTFLVIFLLIKPQWQLLGAEWHPILSAL